MTKKYEIVAPVMVTLDNIIDPNFYDVNDIERILNIKFRMADDSEIKFNCTFRSYHYQIEAVKSNKQSESILQMLIESNIYSWLDNVFNDFKNFNFKIFSMSMTLDQFLILIINDKKHFMRLINNNLISVDYYVKAYKTNPFVDSSIEIQFLVNSNINLALIDKSFNPLLEVINNVTSTKDYILKYDNDISDSNQVSDLYLHNYYTGQSIYVDVVYIKSKVSSIKTDCLPLINYQYPLEALL